MKKRGINDYRFHPKTCLLYKREDVIKFLNKWKVTGIADEMINVTFNRDFYSEGQKDIIKMLNMNRDHCNFLIACVPAFQTLDNQIKNLTKMRITVLKRGKAIIQTPNKTIYSKDKWDSTVNEKIERKWIMDKNKKPNYSRLSTFRGAVSFPALREKSQKFYDEVKTAKRNEIYDEKYGEKEKEEEKKEEQKKEEQPIHLKIVEMLKNGFLKDTEPLKVLAVANNIDFDALRRRVNRELINTGCPTMSSYFRK